MSTKSADSSSEHSNSNENYYVLYILSENGLSSKLSNLGKQLESEVEAFLKNKSLQNLDDEGRHCNFTIGGQLHDCFYKTQTTAKQTYLIVLLALNSLELFRPDLIEYCKNLTPFFDKKPERLELLLSQWYCSCVDYSFYTVQLLKDKVAHLLHLSLYDGKLIIEADPTVTWNISRFMEACRLSNLIHNPSLPPLELTVKVMADNSINIHSKGSQLPLYCEKWAHCLLEENNSVALRKLLETFQLKTVQDLNMLKRLVKKAENDYYTLHEVAQCLSSSGYATTLLQYLQHEAAESSLEIIRIMEEYQFKDKSTIASVKAI